MLQILIFMAVIAMMLIYLPRLAVLAISVMWAGGVCICLWMLGPFIGFPTHRWISDAPWYFGSIFLVCLAFGFFGVSGILRKSGRIE